MNKGDVPYYQIVDKLLSSAPKTMFRLNYGKNERFVQRILSKKFCNICCGISQGSVQWVRNNYRRRKNQNLSKRSHIQQEIFCSFDSIKNTLTASVLRSSVPTLTYIAYRITRGITLSNAFERMHTIKKLNSQKNLLGSMFFAPLSLSWLVTVHRRIQNKLRVETRTWSRS